MTDLLPAPTPDTLLTVATVAGILGVSPITVRRYIAAGQLAPAVRLGGRAGWRIPRSSLRRFIAAHTAEPRPPEDQPTHRPVPGQLAMLP